MGPETSATPLSDLIAVHAAARSSRTWARFLAAFRQAKLGVVAEGPQGVAGEFTTTSERPVAVSLTEHGDGRPKVLAYADPREFAVRFGQPFNAEIGGEALLGTVLANPQCSGILVNSALDSMSVVIDRATVKTLVRSADHRPRKRWWRFG